MNQYFTLQRTLWERRFKDWQLAPWVVYSLGPVLLFLLGHLLFNRSEWASGLVVFMGLSVAQQLSGQKRNDFLKTLYRGVAYRNIRLAENGIVLMPFIVLLLLEAVLRGSVVCGAGALVLCLVGMSMVWWIRRPAPGRSLPTPFSAEPFEYAIGFRRFWWVFLLLFLLLIQGLRVGNYELSAFVLWFTALMGSNLVNEAEPVFFVWIHSLSPKAFLRRKLLLGMKHQAYLMLPVIVGVLAFFSDRWLPTVIIFMLGLAYIVLGMLAKYAIFPKPILVGQAMIIAAGMLLPPLMLIIIPLYYQRSIVRMKIALP